MKPVGFIVLLILLACDSNKNQNSERSMNDPGIPLRELKHQALEKGDTNAYETLSIAYLDFPDGEFLPIAFKMANKFDYSQAYFDTYTALLDLNGIYSPDEPLDKIDPKTKDLAIEYLIIAAVKGHEQSIETLKDYYLKDSINQKIIFTDKIKKEFGDFLNQLNNTNKN